MDPISRLLLGFKRFHRKYFELEPELFATLASKGQSPKIAVVACCDSRVDPAIIMDSEPGDLFIVRNVANLVPPCEEGGQYHGTSAALEFSVASLRVEHIIVLGHAQCGGIGALVQGHYGAGDGSFVDAWMNIVREARDHACSDPALDTFEARARYCELDAIRVSLDNLMTFPWIAERVRDGRLRLHGWYFDLEHGSLLRLDPQTQKFESADA